MAEPFLSEIRIFPYSQVPTGDGWAQCNGQLLPINQNQALFSLLGTTFGGDGRVNFALPDLRARTPIHVGRRPHARRARRRAGAHALDRRAAAAHPRRAGDERDGRHPDRARQPAGRLAEPALRRRQLAGADVAEPDDGHERRRQPGAPEHAAVPDAELRHRAHRHLPEPDLRGARAMAQPFVGEIRMFAGNFAPAGWAFCDGRLLPISENEVLFTLIGTTYGGDGESHVRAAGPPRPDPDPQRQRLHPRRDRRRRADHADGQPDRGAHPPADRDDVGRQPVLAVEQHPGAVDRGRPLHRGHRDGGAGDHAPSRPPAAASRTRTSSRTCASTSSSRCSASSPDSREEPHGWTRS